MKGTIRLFLPLIVFAVLGFSLAAQSNADKEKMMGAWKTTFSNDQGEEMMISVIVTDGYWSETIYKQDEFILAAGGSWKLKEQAFVPTYEFHTDEPEKVGTTETQPYRFEGDALYFEGSDYKWEKVDNGEPGELAGAWLISGRMRDGEIARRETDRPRKTMKILSGTRFQWIAYNTESKEFMGTGGGTYTTQDGKYTERIDFFSRDNSRVGAELPFDFELVDGEWHHKGLSSKGQPIYEIWTLRD